MHKQLTAAAVCLAGLMAAPLAMAGEAATQPACAVAQYRMAVRYQQQSGEIRALRYQAYNVATRQLDVTLAERKGKSGNQPPAVVLDLDETVIDNTPMEAASIAQCHDYTQWDQAWSDWVQRANAPLIQGAKAFLKHADAKGVAIYYVSNRVTKNLAPTVDNLKKLGLPQATADHVLLLGPPKTQRRQTISQNHDIVMLIGDSLHDFDGVFKGAALPAQRKAVDRMRSDFGQRFIILPNASYGSWTQAPLDAPRDSGE